MQTWEVPAEGEPKRARAIELAGHRAGPRALALSSDDGLLLSAAAGAVKLWNPRTAACVRTIETGQARGVLGFLIFNLPENLKFTAQSYSHCTCRTGAVDPLTHTKK